MIEAREKLISKMKWSEAKSYSNKHVMRYWIVRKLSITMGIIAAITLITEVLTYSYIYFMLPIDAANAVSAGAKLMALIILCIVLFLLFGIWKYEEIVQDRAEKIVAKRIERNAQCYDEDSNIAIFAEGKR